MALTRQKYGATWPSELPDEMLELHCAKKWKELRALGATTNHPADHLLRACRMLFTPEQLSIHGWTEIHALDFTETDFCVTLGAGATSKSNNYGAFLYLDWCCDPKDTIVLVGSTTKDALKRRIWEAVLRYWDILQKHPRIQFPGRSKPSGYSIVCDGEDTDGVVAEKGGIFGVALAEGGRLAGAHQKYVRVMVDEISTLENEGGRQAVEEAISNLRKGATSFKLFALCNPKSRFDLGCCYATPLAGWSSVSVESDVWETKFGRARHFDGFKSPAITEPGGKEKYPFLINAETIERDRIELGEDSPRFMEQNRGFPPNQGNTATVLTETDIVNGKATDMDLDGVSLNTIDSSSPFYRTIRVGSLDSAFSAGGDNAILQEARVTYLGDLPTIFFPPSSKIPIVDSSERPVTYQLTDFVRVWALERDIPMDMFACDDSGTQSVADVLTVEIAPGAFRVNYSRSASDLTVSLTSPEVAKKKFRDLIMEAWALLAEFIKFGQVRGLSEECARQLCARQYMTNSKGVIQEPRRLESKPTFKARTKLGSPDHADAAAMAALLIRHRLGIIPGANVYPQSMRPIQDRAPLARLPRVMPTEASNEDPLARLLGKYS